MNEETLSMYSYLVQAGAVMTIIYYLAALAVLSRVSHWAFHTQQKLDRTNYLLAELLRLKGWSPPQIPQAPPRQGIMAGLARGLTK